VARWRKGESGNPRGRPRGAGEIGRLRAAIGQAVPDILDALIEKARTGDSQAAKLLLERTLPAVKAVELPEAVPLEGATLTDQGRAVLRLLAAGEIGPERAAALLSAIGQLARVAEIDDLVHRVEALEGKTISKGEIEC
jgi:hypothetical protein